MPLSPREYASSFPFGDQEGPAASPRMIQWSPVPSGFIPRMPPLVVTYAITPFRPGYVALAGAAKHAMTAAHPATSPRTLILNALDLPAFERPARPRP